jgi:hypothetical protein
VKARRDSGDNATWFREWKSPSSEPAYQLRGGKDISEPRK